jgi:uncharacterized membrane protein
LLTLHFGYAQYAPATLVIKGAEGFIVGYLSWRTMAYTKKGWRVFSFIIGIAVALLVGWVGMNYYSGDIEASFGLPMLGYQLIRLNIPVVAWLIVAIGALILIFLSSFFVRPIAGWLAVSVLVGGLVMITGYFLYEALLFGTGAALIEVPVNIGQLMAGLLVSIPVARSISRLIPRYSSPWSK